MTHHGNPARYNKQLATQLPPQLVGQGMSFCFGGPGIGHQPVPVGFQTAHQHSDGFGGEDVRGLAQDIGQVRIQVFLVDSVATLVEHGAHPFVVGLDVGQDANVTHPVHVDTVSVLLLTFSFVQITARQHIVHVHANSVIEATG